jgi:hypothetical protein
MRIKESGSLPDKLTESQIMEMRFGQYLEYLRIKKKMTLLALWRVIDPQAKVAGFISAVIQGKQKPFLPDTILKFQKIFDKEQIYFLIRLSLRERLYGELFPYFENEVLYNQVIETISKMWMNK